MKLSRYQKEVIKHMRAGAVIVHNLTTVKLIIMGFSQQGPWRFEDNPRHSWCKSPNERTVQALIKRGLIMQTKCPEKEKEDKEVYILTRKGRDVEY